MRCGVLDPENTMAPRNLKTKITLPTSNFSHASRESFRKGTGLECTLIISAMWREHVVGTSTEFKYEHYPHPTKKPPKIPKTYRNIPIDEKHLQLGESCSVLFMQRLFFLDTKSATWFFFGCSTHQKTTLPVWESVEFCLPNSDAMYVYV